MVRTKVRKGAGYSPGSPNNVLLLQDRLALNCYLCGLFGYQDFRGLREVLRDQKEGWRVFCGCGMKRRGWRGGR